MLNCWTRLTLCTIYRFRAMITPQILGKLQPEIRKLVIENMPFFNKRITSLLGVTNSKTIKGQKEGYLTGILYLSPADSVTKETLCAYAKIAGCIDGCLYTAGRGIMKPVHMARVRKTIFYLFYREAFMGILATDIKKLKRKAKREGLTLVIRLNGTSDIQWEHEPYTDLNDKSYTNILEAFPTIQFYDYSKIPTRKVPGNYHLTFSYSDRPEFKKVALKSAILNPKRNVAVVFNGEPPTSFLGKTVISGDNNDLRFTDPENVVVGLTAKGKAKHDTSGFVVNL